MYPRIVTPFDVIVFSPGLVSTQLPPASPARSTMTEPAAVSLDHTAETYASWL